MLNLLGHATTPDKLQLITSQAGDVDIHVSYADIDSASAPPVTQDVSRQLNTFTNAATQDICTGIVGATKRRNVKTIHIRNTHASITNVVTVLHVSTAGTIYELWSATLSPGEQLSYIEGVGWFEAAASVAPAVIGTNHSETATAAGFAADTYLANTAIPLAALGTPTVGRRYIWRLLISKTAAGTATPILTIRVGTAGAIGDTARVTLTWGAGTAAIDRGEIELEAIVSTAGASGILTGKANWTTNLSATGLTSTIKALKVASSAFDLTVANSIIGLSYNGGTSAVHTVEWQTSAQDQL